MSWIKSIVTGSQGWDQADRVETYWIGDPAIDRDKSRADEYRETLDPRALSVRPGKQPTKLLISLPDAAARAEISARTATSVEATFVLAFELCVTFPELENAGATYLGGRRQVDPEIMVLLSKDPNSCAMVAVIGEWICRKSFLSEQEKKASSPASGVESSSPRRSTARSATRRGKRSKAARTSADKESA